MTTKRMSDERLTEIRETENPHGTFGRIVHELIAEIDALRAELTAARTVEDGEVAEFDALLATACTCDDNVDAERQYDGTWHGTFSICTTCKARTFIRRLSAAKAEAERERDEARAQALRSASEAEDWKWAAGDREKERDEARDALAQAREAALEEAAKVVEGQSVATNYLPDRYDVNSLASWLSDRDFRTATAIRALKTTPTQESETP